MEYIPFSERQTHSNSESCTVHEYTAQTTDEIDAAIVELDGRYPEEGWVINKECRALLYVIAKHGRVIPHPDTGRASIGIHAGGQLHIEQGEAYALEGNMKLLFVSTPKWTPEQAKYVDSLPSPTE